MNLQLIYGPAFTLLGVYSREMRLSLHRNLYVHVHNSFIPESPRLDLTPMLFSRRVVKQRSDQGNGSAGRGWAAGPRSSLAASPENCAGLRKPLSQAPLTPLASCSLNGRIGRWRASLWGSGSCDGRCCAVVAAGCIGRCTHTDACVSVP